MYERRRTNVESCHKLGLAFLCLLGTFSNTLLAPQVASAQQAQAPIASLPIGFSKLLFRVDQDGEIGVAREDFRVFILEAMRENGLKAVGAEDLVFDEDRSAEAALTLGGVVRELECLGDWEDGDCRIGIEWLLKDERLDRVVYKVVSRYVVMDMDPEDVRALGKRLIVGALTRLIGRPHFQRLIQPDPVDPVTEENSRAAATVRACKEAASAMPDDAERLLNATLLVETTGGFGSGFVISPDGLALTAHHVVEDRPFKVRTRGGKTLEARVLRSAPESDVALIKIDSPLPEGVTCLSVATEPPSAGTEVWVSGSPASTDLAFSLARGIISGMPTIKDRQFLQTDASVSPGNSGGPVVTADGHVAGVISWKVAGKAVEGVSFAVPSAELMKALALTVSSSTSALLMSAAPSPQKAVINEPFVDSEDPMPSIDPLAEYTRSVTVDTFYLTAAVLQLTGEYQLAKNMSAALTLGAGVGILLNGALEGFTLYEIGGQFRYYFTGHFNKGWHVGSEVVFIAGTSQYDYNPDGSNRFDQDLAAGVLFAPMLGYKWTARNGFTFELQANYEFELLTTGPVIGNSSAFLLGLGSLAQSDMGPFEGLYGNVNVGWSF